MRRQCTGILSIREDCCVVSMASKALLGQRRCGRLATGDVEGEWRTRALSVQAKPLEPLLAATPRLCF
ncbi:unnamed protein product [Spirodela intermedia]|uniref:Uncharacterized protein n=1 Tax=Spirodela intermedia TaxID=51605 RepID=A0ABN7E9I5_SPIIN|nr:unnamed protein product [Spirodela intermedia]